jgi:hypothetical protein
MLDVIMQVVMDVGFGLTMEMSGNLCMLISFKAVF